MMKKLGTFFALVAGMAIIAGPLFAHHGTGISYELDAPLLTMKGTVTEFAWRNPHVTIFLDVTEDNGDVVSWAFEHSNIANLARQGYHRNTLQAGQEVTVVGHPSKSGAPVGLTVDVILADGSKILQRRQAGTPPRN